MATTEEAFRAADLISTAGVGSNGDKLVATLEAHYPPELQSALLRREHKTVTLDAADDYPKLAELLDVDRVEAAAVRGGERYIDDAYVTFVVIEDGVPWKGCLPWPSWKTGSKDGLITQPDEVQKSLQAEQHAEAAAKAGAGSEDVAELQKRLAALENEQVAEPQVVDPEPYEGYADANAKDVIERLAESDDLVAVAAVLAYESRNKDRTTVVEAAQERLAELSAPPAS